MRTTLIAIVALLAVSCGGSDDVTTAPVDDVAGAVEDAVDDAADATGGAVDEAVDDAGGDGVDEAPDVAVGGSGTSTATVTVGDQTFDFEWEADAIQRCDPDFFGGFWALDAAVDGGAGLDAQIWPDDAADPSQVSKITVQLGDDEYTADPERMAGTTVENWPAQVDSFEIDGNRAAGTATFVVNFQLGQAPETAPGTFEINCGG